MTKTRARNQVLILGGGFGGLYAALALEKTLGPDSDMDVTLVNRQNFSLFTPMLHEVAASDLDMTHIVNPVRKLLNRVRFFHGEVEHINLALRQVTVVHGPERHSHVLSYDHLVLALGSTTNFFGLPQLEQRAMTNFRGGSGALRSVRSVSSSDRSGQNKERRLSYRAPEYRCARSC